jgi:biotin synthase
MNNVLKILEKDNFSNEDIITLLHSEGKDRTALFQKSADIKEKYVGNVVYYRGLIEFSNNCEKNCLYCGIRVGNNKVARYNLSDEGILSAVNFAHENKFASVVMQSGEITNEKFITRIEQLLQNIKNLTRDEIKVTLSLGEQTKSTYKRWRDAGADRYLLRIESSNPELYRKIHPQNNKHNFQTRMNCLYSLRKLDYQVGTGIMIGLPFQTYEDIANDLLFMRDFDIDMCGMGPYIEHQDTPLLEFSHLLEPKEKRFDLTIKTIAILRILMKDINIAAATALQAIDPLGREKAIKIGANVLMPNITPGKYRDSYKLYDNKPCVDEDPDDCVQCLEARIAITGNEIGYGKWGDSKHYRNKFH